MRFIAEFFSILVEVYDELLRSSFKSHKLNSTPMAAKLAKNKYTVWTLCPSIMIPPKKVLNQLPSPFPIAE